MIKEDKNILVLCGSKGECLIAPLLIKELQDHFNVLITGDLKVYKANIDKYVIHCVLYCYCDTDCVIQEKIIENFSKIPHIMVIDSDHEIEAHKLLNKGLKDYIFTNSTPRLLPAVTREITAFLGRNKIEQALKEIEKSKNELTLHLENAPFATISWNLDFRVTNWNKAATKLFGYATKEALGKSCLELLTPKHLKDKAKSVIAALIKQKGETDNINETLTKNGDILICQWFNTIVKDEKGKTIGIISAIKDVTQQELSKRKSLKQQRLLEQAQKLSEVYFIDISIDSGKIVLDKEFVKLSGLKPQNVYLAGHLLKNIIHPEDHIQLLRAFKKAFKENTKLAVDVRVIYADGTIRWINILADKFVEDITQKSSFVGTFIDVTERKNKVLNLEEQKQRLNLAVDVAMIGFLNLDINTDNVSVYGKTNEIFALDKNKDIFKASDILSRVHPNDITKVNKNFDLSNNKHETIQMNHRLLLPNGDVTWVNSLGKILYDNNNKPVKIIGTVRDITAQITRERRLLQHSLILNQINSLVLVMDNKNDLIFASPAVNKLTGYTINEVLGQGWWNKSYVSEEEKLSAKNTFSEILSNTKEINNLKFERKVLCKDGAVKWFSWQFSRGTENTLIGLAQDVTLEKEKEYLVSKLFKAIESSPTIVVITDIKGDIEYVNPKFKEVTGYTPEEVVGKNPRFLKSEFTSKKEYETLWETILNGDTWKGEFRNKRKDGSLFWENTIITPVKNAEGVITNFIALKEDITEKKEQEKNSLYALFEAQENEKLRFGEELHDSLSQILSAMSFYLEAVLNPKNKKDHLKVEYLEKVKKLSEDALRESRHISHGLMSKQLLKGGLMSAIEEICDNYNVTKKIKFKFVQTNFREGVLSAQTKQNVYRIIQEISTNIVRHSLATEAKITFKMDKDMWFILEIKDNGIGIDENILKEKSKSFGLKNIKQRVTLLNGKIKRESTIDKGTKYNIKIPVALEVVNKE